VSIRKSSKTKISIRINAIKAPEAHTTLWAIERLVRLNRIRLEVKVDLQVDVPIGAGYGTSAAGTAASCLAVADAAQLPVTFNEIGRLTHASEVVNQTGLGTASAILVGGFVLVTEPGAPGIGEVDRLRFPRNHSIICAYLNAIPTKSMLSSRDVERQVNPAARTALASIRRNPCLETFLSEAGRFSRKAGFQSKATSRIMEIMIANGAVGAAQNMVGEAVHGVARNPSIGRITEEVTKEFPAANIFVSELDICGVRLVEN